MWDRIVAILKFIGRFLKWRKWKTRAEILEKEKRQVEARLDIELQTAEAERQIRDAADGTAPHGGGPDDDLLNADSWNAR